jgi:pimeloyl-ACP methyl ester carboxylesterase
MTRTHSAPRVHDSLLALLVGCLVTASCATEPSSARAAKRADQVFGRAGMLHVDDGGKGGMPVVFVHSFGGNTAHWTAQLDHLRRSRRAVALDLRGHGKSAPPPDGDYAIRSLAEDIGAAVDGLGIERFVLVGHSLGAAAASAYAGAHPERVAGLVLVGAPGKVPEQQAHQVKAAMEASFEATSQEHWNKLLAHARPEGRERIEREMHSVSREASLSLVEATFEYDPVPAIESYPGPKLIVATGEQVAPHELHNLMPEIRVERMYGTSHWPHLDRPGEFDRILDEFLERAE